MFPPRGSRTLDKPLRLPGARSVSLAMASTMNAWADRPLPSTSAAMRFFSTSGSLRLVVEVPAFPLGSGVKGGCDDCSHSQAPASGLLIRP